jgi:cysteine-rich repeat protein
MNRRTTYSYTTALALACIALAQSECTSPTDETSLRDGEFDDATFGRVSISMHGVAAPDDVDEVWVEFDRVSAKHDDFGWFTVSNTPHRVDLANLDENAAVELGLSRLPVGSFKHLRLRVTDSWAVADGDIIPVKVPGGQSSGLKIGHDFDVPECGDFEIQLEWNAAEELVSTNNGYNLKPKIDASDASQAGECDPDVTNAIIPPEGGEVEVDDGELVVTVPGGALDENVVITVEPAEPTVPGTIGAVRELGPEGLLFDEPVSIAFELEAEQLAAHDVADLSVATLVDQVWESLVPDPDYAGSQTTVAGLTTHFSPYAVVPPMGEPPSLAGGNGHMCALFDDGTIKCWGRNADGELGQGNTDVWTGDVPNEMGGNLLPVDFGTGLTAAGMTLGNTHTCVLVAGSGEVKCWGVNNAGNLGLGDTQDRGGLLSDMGDNLQSVDLGTGRTAQQVAAGSNSNCALLDDDTVKCWGINGKGELGQGDTVWRGDDPGEMGDNLPTVDTGSGTVTKIVSGVAPRHCIHLDNLDIKCWGSNQNGALGQEDTEDRGDEPGELGDNLPAIDLGTGRHATQLAMGFAHVCALLDDATIKCWGQNGEGQLGQGNQLALGNEPNEMGDNLPTVDLGTGRTAKWVGAGVYSTCAILDDDTVKCWGRNDDGPLGVGDEDYRGDDPNEMGDNLPVADVGSEGVAVTTAGAGGLHCAALSNNGVKCWGHHRILGLGTNDSRGDEANEMGDNLPYVMLTCGDGTQEYGEDCDLGAGNSNGGATTCTLECQAPACGDELVTGIEVCDDGFNNGVYDFCAGDCTGPGDFCGDNAINGPETCDDGTNDGSYGTCNEGCLSLAPHCGDGFINGAETCDDGNANPGDGCDASCLCEGPCPDPCGNGILDFPETCDDGNNVDGDGCSALCECELISADLPPEYWITDVEGEPEPVFVCGCGGPIFTVDATQAGQSLAAPISVADCSCTGAFVMPFSSSGDHTVDGGGGGGCCCPI